MFAHMGSSFEPTVALYITPPGGLGVCGLLPRCVSKAVTAVTLSVTLSAERPGRRSARVWGRAMSDGAAPGLVERAHSAAAGGGWQQAFDLFMEADADGLLAPADLPVLGEVAYAAGHLDVT